MTIPPPPRPALAAAFCLLQPEAASARDAAQTIEKTENRLDHA
jgi:hypothetical protein